jgi:hypothetical protein
MPSRAERIGNNENLFREVNARIEEVGEQFGVHETGDFRIVCECGLDDCTEPIDLTLGEYTAVRENPIRFLLVPGHELPDVERVVEEREGYNVVEKLPGEPAEVAREGYPER